MELTGGADCGALEGEEKSERVEERVANGGSVRVERFVRPLDETFLNFLNGNTNWIWEPISDLIRPL